MLRGCTLGPVSQASVPAVSCCDVVLPPLTQIPPQGNERLAVTLLPTPKVADNQDCSSQQVGDTA